MKNIFLALATIISVSSFAPASARAQQTDGFIVQGTVASEIVADLRAAGIPKSQGVDATNYTARSLVCRHVVVTQKDSCTLNDRTDAQFNLQSRSASELTALLESSGVSHRILVDVEAIQVQLISCTSNIVTGFKMRCLIQP